VDTPNAWYLANGEIVHEGDDGITFKGKMELAVGFILFRTVE
jgi:hypothetical protein